ncbi:hypothetical protein EJB05_57226, partial [Eragrostis curvula]
TERRRHWLRFRAAWRSRRPSSLPLRPGKPIPIEHRSARELADPSTSSIRDAFFPVSESSASQDHTKTAPAILDTPPSPHPAPDERQEHTPVITVRSIMVRAIEYVAEPREEYFDDKNHKLNFSLGDVKINGEPLVRRVLSQEQLAPGSIRDKIPKDPKLEPEKLYGPYSSRYPQTSFKPDSIHKIIKMTLELRSNGIKDPCLLPD